MLYLLSFTRPEAARPPLRETLPRLRSQRKIACLRPCKTKIPLLLKQVKPGKFKAKLGHIFLSSFRPEMTLEAGSSIAVQGRGCFFRDFKL